MNSLNQFAVCLFASGDAFFVGAGLIVTGRGLTWMLRQRRGAKWLRLLTVLGVIVFVFSITPLPWWLYGLAAILPLLGLNAPFRIDDGKRWRRIIRRAQPLVEILLFMAVTAELLERQQLHVLPLKALPTEVHVIGDSLSADIADEPADPWPNLVSRHWQVPVHNHAHAGATTASAFRQAEEIDGDDCLVLIEIGGNDLLSGRDSRQIEADLDRLLARLSGSRRTLVMFELPVPPIPGAYDWARLQRRLALHYRTRLIPRRDFSKVLLAPGATSDGLHLTPIGHRALANLVIHLLSPPRSLHQDQSRPMP